MRIVGNALGGLMAVAMIVVSGAAWAEEGPAPTDPKFFETKVYPIFQSRCVSCHGPEKQKAKLRLDTAEGINAGGEDGPIFVASKSAESLVVQLVSKPAGDDDIMPPSGDPLTAEQIATIAAWIDAGASLGDFKTGAPKEQNANAAAADSAVSMAAPSEVKPYDGGVLAALAKSVQPAAPEAVKALTDAGALALNIDRSSPLLSVNFQLAGQQVDDAKLAALAQAAPQITWLNLANTKVTDAGLSALASLPNLTMLHLERTGIGDAGLDALAGLQHLEYLNLYGTQVSDAGLAKLAGLKSLKKLYVWQSKVTSAGVDAVKAAIPGIYVNSGIEVAAPVPAPAAEPMPAPTPAEPAPAPEATAAKAPELAQFFDKEACCARGKAEGKDCEHPCCKEAREAGKVCAQCNPLGAKKLAALDKATGDTCCAKSKGEGKLCDHPCCKEALDKGELCTKCNPQAAAAAIELQFDENGCCALAKAGGKACDHPCCAEARTAGKACEKCNPKSAAKKDVV